MGSVRDAFDNAMAESFFSTLVAELLSRRFASQAGARVACFSYIESWYNPVRLHSELGYRSPMAYEANRQTAEADHVVPKSTNCPRDRVNLCRSRSAPVSCGWPAPSCGALHAKSWASAAQPERPAGSATCLVAACKPSSTACVVRSCGRMAGGPLPPG